MSTETHRVDVLGAMNVAVVALVNEGYEGVVDDLQDASDSVAELIQKLGQIERLSRTADRSTIDVASMLGEIARDAIARLEVRHG